MLISVGSNATSQLGDARTIVETCLSEMRARFDDLVASRLFRTPAFPAGAGPDFVNAACLFRTNKMPKDVLAELHSIEADFGRTRTQRWGQRTLDLDLIASGQIVTPDKSTFEYWQNLPFDAQKTDAPDQLILPHPRLQDRPFVLIPLADVAPDWIHPILGLSITQMIAAQSDAARAEIVPL